MSVFTSPPPIPSATSIGPSSSSSASNSNNNGGFSTASSFYRNLFYILVGVLVVFLVITLLSYIRTRRRRQIIEAEARRLGLLVPGMAGYLTERARLAAALKGQKSSVKETPLLWDFMSKESMKEQGPSDTKDQKLGSDCVNFADISPISITPLLPMPPLEPIPVSSLKYFPNAMAFRAPKPEISAETILKDWEAKLKSGPNLQQDADHDGRTGGRKRGRTRGKSLLEQYPQQHVPPLRLSIERPRPRKTSRAAELADQLGNKIFGPPSLPARVPHGDIDLEAQVGASASSRANTGVEMVQIGTGVTAASNATHVVGGVNPMQSPTDTRKTATIPPTIQLMTFVRMPIPEHSRELVGKRTWHMTSEEEQEKAVQAEWAGVELGVTEMEVVGNTYPTGGDVWGSSR